jgi:hypothetical protein
MGPGVAMLALGLLLAAAMPAARQQVGTQPRREALARVVSLLEGRWVGSGTLAFDPQRQYAVSIDLTAAPKSDATVLLLEAAYTLTPRSAPHQPTSHDEVAVFSFNDGAQRLQVDIFFADGHHEAGTVTVEDTLLRLTTPLPAGGTRRITIDRSSPDEWHEIGERSTDGKAWQTYFESKTTRTPTR